MLKSDDFGVSHNNVEDYGPPPAEPSVDRTDGVKTAEFHRVVRVLMTHEAYVGMKGMAHNGHSLNAVSRQKCLADGASAGEEHRAPGGLDQVKKRAPGRIKQRGACASLAPGFHVGIGRAIQVVFFPEHHIGTLERRRLEMVHDKRCTMPALRADYYIHRETSRYIRSFFDHPDQS